MFGIGLNLEGMVVDDRDGEVQDIVAVRGDEESALHRLVVALRHAPDLYFVILMHEALQLQQTLPESAAFYPLQVLLETVLDFLLEPAVLYLLAH